MAAAKGNCYLCGQLMGKAGFKRHFLAAHPYEGENGQKCVLLKVENAGSKSYWLYLDMPVTSTLKTLDSFLRKIWLECCGHLSEFHFGRMPISMSTAIGSFSEGCTLSYEYDFGSTTELVITIMGSMIRPRQKAAVRLLGRNEPYHFTCQNCGKEADYICPYCIWEKENPFLCEGCVGEHEHEEEILLPVVNSPRMGVCGYCGEQDVYGFTPERYKK